MTPDLTLTHLAGSDDLPLLVVGPSIGTTAATLWRQVADRLGDRFRVIGWDLPGHGPSAPATGFSVEDLAAGVLASFPDETFDYAGDSVGGAVGLCLALEEPHRVRTVSLLCTGARIGDAAMWRERAALVRDEGTKALLDTTPGRWFAPGFTERDVSTSQALLDDLASADASSYAAVCEALAVFDARSRLADVSVPVLAVAGEHDVAAPPALLRRIADGVRHGRYVCLPDVAHLAPAEAPEEVAHLVADHALTAVARHHDNAATTLAEVRAAGMQVRREVLGDEHVDRASEAVTDLTRDFQDLITTYAWGSIWTRPGLDRRSRSMITLTALVARGHHEELAMHLRAALRNGLTRDEIREVLLQAAIYCGVPDANTAFRVAQQVLDESDQSDESEGGTPRA